MKPESNLFAPEARWALACLCRFVLGNERLGNHILLFYFFEIQVYASLPLSDACAI